MADNISNIIAPSVYGDIDKLIQRLVEVEGEIAAINAKPLTIKVDLGGLDSITQLNEMLKRQDIAIQQVIKTVSDYKEATAQLNAVQAVHGQGVTDNVKQLTQQKLELGYVTEQLKILNKDIQAGNGNIDQNNEKLVMWTKRQQELKVELSATQQQLKSQIKDTYAAVGSMDEMSLKLGQLREKFRALSAEQRNSPFGHQLQKDIFALDKGIKELDASIGNSQRNVGNYGSVWDSLGNSIKSVGTYITRDVFRGIAGGLVFGIAASAIQSLIDSFMELSDAEQLAADRLKTYEDNLKSLNDFQVNINANTEVQRQQVESLLNIISSQTTTIEAKTKAYNDLNAIMPGVLKNYSLEKIASEGVSTALRQQANYVVELSNNIKANKEIYAKELVDFGKLKEEYEKPADPSNHTTSYLREQDRIKQGYFGLMNDLKVRRAEIQRDELLLANYVAPELKKPKKAKAEREDRSADDLSKSIYEQRKAELEADMKVQKEIGDNTQVSLQIRLDSYKRYYNDIERLAFAEGERDIQLEKNRRERLEKELKSGKIKSPEFNTEIEASKKREQAVLEKYYSAVLTANTNLATANEKIYQDEVNKRNAIIKGAADNNKTAMDEELLALSERYAKGLIKEEDYQRQKKQIQDKYATSYLNDVVAYLQHDIANSNLSNEAKKKLIDELTDYERKALEQQIRNNEDAAKKKEVSWKEAQGLAVQLAQQTLQSIVTIVGNEYQEEAQKIDRKEELYKRQFENEKLRIEATSNNRIEASNRIARLEAQNLGREAEFEQQRKANAIKKAKFEKEAAEAGIILNTALALAKVLPLYSDPLTIPLAITETALITAIGAAQYAAAASAPIPQYKFGTPSSGTHTPVFIAGDGGERELIAPPNKDPYWSSDKSTIYKEPLGTHVIPMDKIIRFATANVTAMPPVSLQQAESQKRDDKIMEYVAKYIGNKIEESNDDVVRAIMRSNPQVVVNVPDNYYSKTLRD